ncbi:hypothetical protein AB833_22020 [Chromatiales bacterium (ex Bugula neritina AB1)]|nr:hypothetical protein AB833_22020 [Chromatiales bacterium (ex Bugula neritina AB1)]
MGTHTYTRKFSSSRRSVLLATLASACVPLSDAIAAVSTYPELRLKLYNLHTEESINTVFWANGSYVITALNQFDYLLRDHRTGGVKEIDTRLLSILYLINQRLGNKKYISVISGYRSAETNRKLALRNSGVAKNSYHIKGRAIDIRINGYDSKIIRDAGVSLRVGGVGYYQKSDFVHLDTGPRRIW